MRHPRDMAPLLKFIGVIGFIASAYVIRDPVLIAGLILAEGAIALACGAFRTFRLTLATLLFAAFTLCLFQIFTISEGQTAFYLIPPLRFGRITDSGLSACLLLSVRMIASVGSIPLMLSITSQTQIVSLISGTFRLPPAYTVMFITALRFIPTFGERMRAVLQAEASRGYNADSGNPLRKVGMVMRMSLPLLVSCARDVDTLALSLETRGFDPSSKARPRSIAPLPSDFAYLSVCLALQAALVVIDRLQ
jgi:energy-coupling factor transport system permease protein